MPLMPDPALRLEQQVEGAVRPVQPQVAVADNVSRLRLLVSFTQWMTLPSALPGGPQKAFSYDCDV